MVLKRNRGISCQVKTELNNFYLEFITNRRFRYFVLELGFLNPLTL